MKADSFPPPDSARDPGSTVRLLAWLLALFAVVAWAGWHAQWTAAQPELAGYNWRRTVTGWEHVPAWRPPAVDSRPAFHPLLLASVQLAASLLALSGGSRPAKVTCPSLPGSGSQPSEDLPAVPLLKTAR